ncbi:MAG: hypothetical protein Kow006_30500 [Gammaproteobacteria bacterium]
MPVSDETLIPGVVTRGYGVASGLAGDPRFPEGTLALQFPLFRERGLSLDECYPGTVNVDISPLRFAIQRADFRFERLRWSAHVSAETFSFCRCRLLHQGNDYPAWIYYPHPETKPEHFHSASILEVVAPFIAGLDYGDAVTVHVAEERVRAW